MAEHFEREHKHVMEAIRNLECSDDFNRSNFRLVDYLDSKGEKRPMFMMNRDGFSFLVMGFTGTKAAQLKEAYIRAFNAMERQLSTESAKSAFGFSSCWAIGWAAKGRVSTSSLRIGGPGAWEGGARNNVEPLRKRR